MKSNTQNSISLSITKFCNHFGRDVQSIILYGSYAKNTQHKNSDVDILVIDDTFSPGCRIQKIVDGYPIQAVMISFKELLKSIDESPQKSNPFLLDTFIDPVILFDKNDLCKYATMAAQRVSKKGAIVLSEPYLELMRIGIINYMNDGTSEKYIGSRTSERVVWATKLLTMLEDYLLAKSGGWLKNNPKYKKINLLEDFSHLREALHKELENYLNDHDSERYVSNIKSIIEKNILLDWDTTGKFHAAIL